MAAPTIAAVPDLSVLVSTGSTGRGVSSGGGSGFAEIHAREQRALPKTPRAEPRERASERAEPARERAERKAADGPSQAQKRPAEARADRKGGAETSTSSDKATAKAASSETTPSVPEEAPAPLVEPVPTENPVIGMTVALPVSAEVATTVEATEGVDPAAMPVFVDGSVLPPLVEGVASPVIDPLNGLVEPSPEALGMDGEDILPVVTLQPVVAGAATSVPTPTPVSLSLATSVPAPAAQALAMLEAEPTTLELDLGGEGDSEFDGLLGLARQGRLDTRSPSAVLTQYTTRVETPLQQPNWSDHFAGKLAWLANQRIQVAEIHINPQDLGPVEVRIQMQQDQASIVVHSPHPTVRELLESQGHRLRDMLQQNGVELAQLDVSDQSTRQQAGQQGDGHGQGGAHSGSADGDALGLLTGGEGGVLQSGEGLVRDLTRVDLFV